MPDEPTQTQTSNGAAPAEPRPSLREVAEASWNDVQEEAAADDGDSASDDTSVASGQQSQPRDNLGRFVAADQQAKPGEQSSDPAPQTDPVASSDAQPDPAPSGSSNQQPPQHWSEQDRQTFAKLPPEGQEFLLRRHTEMERDYQTKTQAAATAVQFTQSLAPMFQHPALAGSLQQANLSPFEAIGQWAGFHLRAIDPNPQVRIGLLQELAQRMGLDPAANGQMSQPALAGLSEEDLKDPAIRSFADYLGRTHQDVQTLRGELQWLRQQQAEAVAEEAVKVRRSEIDRFADEVDAQGKKLRPHFDNQAVMTHMMDLYRSNPARDLKEAYEMACWAVPEVRSQLVAAERNAVTQQQANEKARQAVRSNVRGITSPVAKPAADGQAKGLRAVLEEAAEEVGLN